MSRTNPSPDDHDEFAAAVAHDPPICTLQDRDAESNRVRGEILAQVSDAVIAVDADQRVTYLNAAAERQHGLDAATTIGCNLAEMYAIRWLRPEDEAEAMTALRQRGEWRGENIHITRADRDLHVESSVTLTRADDGSPTGMVAVIRDMTERKHETAEAQRVSALLDTVLHTAPIGMCFLDRDLRYLRINARFAEMNGVSADAHVGRHVSEIVPALVDTIVATTDRIVATGEPVLNHEYSGEPLAASGVTRFFSESWYPVRDGAGELSGFGAIVEDITARKQAEDALRESHEFTRRVLDHTLAVFVGVTTADGTLTYANLAPLEAAGIAASEVIGKKFWDCHWWSYSPEIQAQLREACERAASGEIVRYDVPVRMAGDTRVWIDFQVAPLRDAGGRITHLIPSAVEITVRRAAQEKQRESEERTRLATEATAVGIWERNIHTDALRWDAQMFQLYGIPPTADGFLSYTDWSHAVLPEDLPENERILQDTVRRSAQSRREFRIRRRDNGAVRYVESVETVRANSQGETEWVVGTNLDVTERKTSEMQLRQLAADLSEADRRKDEFLATLAHELRNPLAPIRNGLELMKLAGGEIATIERARGMMERQLTQLVRLVDDLMDVSRISRGNFELRKERVPLATVVQSALESSRPLIERMGHQLTVTLPAQPLFIDADLTRLAQVFLNLLNNAAKYSEQHAHIHLYVEREGSDLVVTVKDNGIGIAADQLSRIFDMFTQVVQSLEKAQGGLGIGLTLVKRLVEMHGGTVEAKSDGLGKGSEFVVRLPVVIATAEPHALDGATEQSVGVSRRILVVDDNTDAAESLAEILKVLGNDTRTASDGQAGIDMAAEFRPEVILLDIGLPTLDGYDVCRAIRAQPWGTDILLIAVTGWGQHEDRRRSHEAGFDHHMVKPVDPRVLMTLLDEFGAGHEADDTHRTSRADISERASDCPR